MVEDIARNLAPAAELGMTTAWVCNELDWAAAGSDGDYIHHIVDDLAGFLVPLCACSCASRRNPGRYDQRRRDDPRAKLTERLAPTRLEIVDESHRHAGHAGARPEGETHFAVTIVSAAFAGLTGWRGSGWFISILADELATRVHALSLTTLAPDEPGSQSDGPRGNPKSPVHRVPRWKKIPCCREFSCRGRKFSPFSIPNRDLVAVGPVSRRKSREPGEPEQRVFCRRTEKQKRRAGN